MLADDIAWALPELRAEAESRMTSTCVATIPGEGDPVWNPDTQQWDDPVETVYEGPCRLRMGNPAPQNADAGETSWAVDRTPTLSLPLSDPTSAAVVDGVQVTITGNPNDPAMVGLRLRVLSGHYQTDSTARRVPVEVVSRDV